MEIPPLLIQSAVSLAAILVLSWLAFAMKLGGRPTLTDEGTVRLAANEVEDGFCTQRIALSDDGLGALIEDDQGRIMVIKRHGNRFAGRILTHGANVETSANGLRIDCREKRFGKVTLKLDDPSYWVNAIKRI